MGPQLYRCGNGSRLRFRPRKSDASMGPQLYRCGNSIIAHAASSIFVCFNGAATLSLRKPSTLPRALSTSRLLQWGRNFIVAETPPRPPGRRVFRPASMGPQLYRCGNQGSPGRDRSRAAASMGPQLYRCGNLKRLAYWLAADSSFNGAATLSLRKRRRRSDIAGSVWHASMGPQLYRCGNVEISQLLG